MKVDRHQLRTARNCAKLTIFEVANAVGIARSSLVRIEDGTTASPAPDLLAKLVAYYEVVGIIFREDGEVELRPGLHRPGPHSSH